MLTDGHYVINGQKIWTSYAGLADTCFLLTRTSDDRKKGITIILVPMDTPGITVRQIPSLIGEGDIHEVFFDDVTVPETARFGREGQAWRSSPIRSAMSVWASRASPSPGPLSTGRCRC
ncbi:acyl-CoA dehydrogenase family protein [Novosphingobium panipatense]